MDNLAKQIFDDINNMNEAYRNILLGNENQWKCPKCGSFNPESQYDCWNCHYSSGGD